MSVTVIPCDLRLPHDRHDWTPEPSVINRPKRCPGVQEAESRRMIVHVYGFMDKPIPLSIGLCPEATVPEAVERIRSNIEHFGGTVVDFRRTYPLGGSPADSVEARFYSPAHGETRGIWHVVAVARDDEWAAKP